MLDSLRPGRFTAGPAGDHLAARREAGRDGFSGMVAPDAPINHTDPDAGGAIEDTGHHEVLTSPQLTDDLRPIPGVVTRKLFGGLRVSRRTELLHESPPFTGGHLEVVGRRYVVERAPDLVMQPLPEPTLPSLRVPPVSDPLGRMCANAAAAKGAGK